MTSMVLAILAAAPGADDPSGPFSLEPGLIVWTWVVFLALFFLLRRFAWPVLLKATEEREQRIQKQLEAAEQANTQAQQTLEEHKKLVAGSRAEAQRLIDEAKKVAEEERAALLEQTRAEQEQLVERAKREIVAERERAVQDLRREAVDLSLAAAGRLIGEKLDDESDRRIVTEYLESLGERH